MTETFNDLYLHELELVASAEAQLGKHLPRLVKTTDTAELVSVLTALCESSEKQLTEVQNLLKQLGFKGRVPLGAGMEALIEESLVLLREFPGGDLRDAVIIAQTQRALHYMIAAYASLENYAHLLGKRLAEETLAQAGKATVAASKRLQQIAIQVDAEAYVDHREERT